MALLAEPVPAPVSVALVPSAARPRPGGITRRPFLCPEFPPLPPTPDHSVTGVETVAS